MKGRKPKPTRLRMIEGNRGKRPLPKSEPMPRGNLTTPPSWLTPEQKVGWRYAIRHAPCGLLKPLDRSILTIWVVAEDLHRQASEAQAKTELFVKSPNGAPMQSPYLAVINRQATVMMKAASEMGFSPVSRPRIQVSTMVRWRTIPPRNILDAMPCGNFCDDAGRMPTPSPTGSMNMT